MTSPMEATTLALANDTSTEHDAEASSQQFWENGFNGSEPFDWPNEFSLDTRQGYSSQLIGLSNESDPYLLRHYLYNVHDTYPMFRLDFRKVVEDSTIQAFADTQNSTQSNLPVDDMPIQFVMIDETICQEDLRAVDTMFSHASTEVADIELLHKLVPADLGAKLLTLYVHHISRLHLLTYIDIPSLSILSILSLTCKISDKNLIRTAFPNIRSVSQRPYMLWRHRLHTWMMN